VDLGGAFVDASVQARVVVNQGVDDDVVQRHGYGRSVASTLVDARLAFVRSC
jgi:hypothetical protein